MSVVTHAVRETNRSARMKRTVIRTLEYLALFLACFIALLPIWSSFTTSFKGAEEYATTNAMTLPRNWFNFGNYAQVWTQGDMLRAFLTSASVVIVVVTVSVMMGSMLAYVLNRFRFPGNHLSDHEGPGVPELHRGLHDPHERHRRHFHLYLPPVF